MYNLESVYIIVYYYDYMINDEKFIDDYFSEFYFESVEDAHSHLINNSFKLIPSENPLSKLRYDNGNTEACIVPLDKYNRGDYNWK